jgi:hypothetical protein
VLASALISDPQAIALTMPDAWEKINRAPFTVNWCAPFGRAL